MEKQGRPVIASRFGTGRVLTDAMTIRRKVFMIEENVSEKDEIDGRDDRCLHYVFYVDNWYPVSTARIYLIGKNVWHIGRVATLKTFRGRGYARQILKRIEKNAESKNIKKLELEAQVHAISFYESLGYEAFGNIFLDAGIQHRRMEKLLK
ncbi:acetyltransferase [Oenococcus oeni IOEB_0607]|uniref:GNAT family N-acetyltransferase n=1 Tax=Oenococcus oeni TaxID=1247 RepID=UPI00050FFFD1|nr:GNAT family N-acetyltransferase [Oenococcus oeni]KGH79425.1 acetyltransferase [Oenococcus oeni IOEB_0607]